MADDAPATTEVERAPPEGEPAVYEAPAVLRQLWADPQHMPEHLAIWTVKRFGSRAEGAVEKIRRAHPEAETGELQRLAIEHQTRVSMAEGAFVGGPFILLIPVAFCAALLSQGQMALELAAIAGHSPRDEMRAADLLVIQGAYPSTEAASEALGKVARDPGSREGKRLPRGARTDMVKRMAYLLGVLGSGDEPQSRLRTAFQYALLAAVFLVGLVLPLVWVPYMTWAVRNSALRMGRHASAFYAERGSAETGVTVSGAPVVSVSLSAGLIRMALLIAIPLVVAVLAFFTDLDIGGGKLLSALILLFAISALLTLGWLGFQRWRRGRASS